jgi:alpha-tubulin suppressor-like RCC1 family protein
MNSRRPRSPWSRGRLLQVTVPSKRLGALLALALVAVAALPAVTASGAYFTDQTAAVSNSATAATYDPVASFTATKAGSPSGADTQVTWSKATDLAWAKANGVTSDVAYTVKRSATDDFTNARTVYNASGTTTSATFSTTDTGKNPTYRTNTITSGSTYTCALSITASAFCWGANVNGQLGNQTYSSSNTPVKVVGAVAGKNLVSIQASPSGTHTCALDSEGVAYCWGLNSSGQLGNNSTARSNVAVPVSTAGVLKDKKVATIAVGDTFTCATDTVGAAYCWGSNSSKQLGVDSATQSSVPVAVDTSAALKGKFMISVSAGYGSACALDADGLAYCWGSATQGVLGNGTTTDTSAPIPVTTASALKDKALQQISVGRAGVCALDTAGVAYCWSSNTFGQAGTGNTTSALTPTLVKTSETFASIAVGAGTVCAATPAGALYCWGDNSAGQFSTGSTAAAVSSPTRAGTSGTVANKTIVSISVGQATACFIAGDGTASCSGNSAQGALGASPTVTSTTSAVAVAAITDTVLFSKTSNTNNNGCGISQQGNAYCWGVGTNGALGTGTTTTTHMNTPVKTDGVLKGRTVTDISVGGGTSATACAIADGDLFCWGSNASGSNGLVGLGTTSPSQLNEPVAVNLSALVDSTAKPLATAPKFKQVDVGTQSACALTTANVLYCWGAASMLGNGTTNTTYAPSIPVPGTFTSFSVSGNFSCAVLPDKRMQCWGDGSSYQLGTNSTNSSTLPTFVLVQSGSPITGVESVATARLTTCIIQTLPGASTKTVACWGDDTYGQLGKGGTANGRVPTNPIAGLSNVSSLEGYRDSFCAVGSEGLFCWGDGTSGAIGNGGTANATTPAKVVAGASNLSLVASVQDGRSPCFTTTTGLVYCWGPNAGAFGAGTTTSAFYTGPSGSSSSPVLSALTPATPTAYSQYAQKCAAGSVSIAGGLCSLRDTGSYNYQLQYTYKGWSSAGQVAKRP